MAALLATLQIDIKIGDGQDAVTQKAWFLGAPKLYAPDGNMAAATGITDVTQTLGGKVPLYDVDTLLLHGHLRTVEVDLAGSDNKVVGQRSIRYSGLKSATIEADVIGKTYNGAKTQKFNGTKVVEVIERRKKSFV